MTSDDVDSRKLKNTATKVANACGGLPIAITTMARAFRNKSDHEQMNALRELETPSQETFEGVPAEAYSTIELSYKYLKSEQTQENFFAPQSNSTKFQHGLVQIWYGFGHI